MTTATTAGHPDDKPTVEADGTGTAGSSEASPARLPYKAPRLRHLGSVRELTLGATGSAADGGATKMIRM